MFLSLNDTFFFYLTATTTLICEPWTSWGECTGEKCKDKTKRRTRVCPQGTDTEEQECFIPETCNPGACSRKLSFS